MSEAEEREVVQIGVDLRPVPLRLPGEEQVWHFNADPDVEFFSTMEKAGTAMESDSDDRWEAVNTVRSVLMDQLIYEDEKVAFKERNYGFAALIGLSKAYTQQVVGTPTQPSSPSGAGPGRRGARK